MLFHLEVAHNNTFPYFTVKGCSIWIFWRDSAVQISLVSSTT